MVDPPTPPLITNSTRSHAPALTPAQHHDLSTYPLGKQHKRSVLFIVLFLIDGYMTMAPIRDGYIIEYSIYNIISKDKFCIIKVNKVKIIYLLTCINLKYTFIHMHTYAPYYIYIYIYIYIYVCVCVICVCVCVCVYVCMYVCVCVCMCDTYTYTMCDI